jgi:hypothetical protein
LLTILFTFFVFWAAGGGGCCCCWLHGSVVTFDTVCLILFVSCVLSFRLSLRLFYVFLLFLISTSRHNTTNFLSLPWLFVRFVNDFVYVFRVLGGGRRRLLLLLAAGGGGSGYTHHKNLVAGQHVEIFGRFGYVFYLRYATKNRSMSHGSVMTFDTVCLILFVSWFI